MDVAGSEFFCYRGVRLDLRRKPVAAADSGAEIGFSASLLKNNFRPPVWKTPPPSTLEAETVAGKADQVGHDWMVRRLLRVTLNFSYEPDVKCSNGVQYLLYFCTLYT